MKSNVFIDVNLIESSKKCVNCGICKSVCPVFLSLRKESYSPRGRMILINFYLKFFLSKNSSKYFDNNGLYKVVSDVVELKDNKYCNSFDVDNKNNCENFNSSDNKNFEDNNLLLNLQDVLSVCMLCSSCDNVCPVNIPLHDVFLEFRKILSFDGIISEKNKKMISNIKKNNNPFSDVDDGEFYCC